MTRTANLRKTSIRQAALEQSVGALAQATEVNFAVVEPAMGAQAEATLELDGDLYQARIRTSAQHAPLAATIEQIKRHPHGILIADYVSPERADRFRDADVAFLDTVGNAFLRTPRHYVFIKGNPRPRPLPGFGKPIHHRAFTTSGAKVTFALLCQPELAGEADEIIADVAGVSLGTVCNVFHDLAESDHLESHRSGGRRLVRREDLADTWVERYPGTLRPTFEVGSYQAGHRDWWRSFDVNRYGGYWGGEVAGALYTDHHDPAVATIYVPKPMQLQLIATAHLRKLPRPTGGAGTVMMLAPFWRHHPGQPGLVHPLLAYADLIASEEPRNIAMARELYRQRLAPRLESDL